MRFQGIRLVEQTEQKFHRFESFLKKKTSDCNSQALLLVKAPTKNAIITGCDGDSASSNVQQRQFLYGISNLICYVTPF